MLPNATRDGREEQNDVDPIALRTRRGRLGAWSSATEDYRLPATTPGLKSALLIQDGPGGPILAAARL
jgi:hypothetical protein